MRKRSAQLLLSILLLQAGSWNSSARSDLAACFLSVGKSVNIGMRGLKVSSHAQPHARPPHRYLLRIAGQSIFSGADAAANLSAVARGLSRPLQPELGDSAATFAGPALLALLTSAPSAIAPAIPSLLSAIAGGLVHL